MKRDEPAGLDRRRVERLLSKIENKQALSDRSEAISREFLGRPYKTNPLIGSAETPEVFTASLASFDCVTFLETVIALARASETDDFIASLRRIRYDGGRVQWHHRNHYIADWIRNNVRSRIITPVSLRGIPTVTRNRRLNIIRGLPARRIQLKCVPRRAIPQLESRIRTGDLIFFASTRRNLDVFHAGIVVHDGKALVIRHAARSRGGVVEQRLQDFLHANRMAGVILMRPRAKS